MAERHRFQIQIFYMKCHMVYCCFFLNVKQRSFSVENKHKFKLHFYFVRLYVILDKLIWRYKIQVLRLMHCPSGDLINETMDKIAKTTQLYLLIGLFSFALFTACSEPPHGTNFKDYFSKTEVVALKGETVALMEGEKPLSYMFNMTFFDSLIMVNEFPDREYTYKLIDLRDKSVRLFGKKGEGPNQLLSDAFYFSVDQKDKRLYLTDQVHYYIHDIDDLKRGQDEPAKKFTIDQQEKRFMGSTVHVDGYIVGSMYHKRFCAYHIEDGDFIEVGEYPGGPSMAMANQSFFMNHPTNNMAVYGMTRVPEFGVLTVLQDTIEVNKFSWGDTPLDVHQSPVGMGVVDKEGSTYEYTSVAATENYIYFLYSGKTIDESSRETMIKSGLSNEVFVLDWEGKPVKRYLLDQPTRSIAVDDQAKILYAASFEKEPKLVAYPLNGP